MYIHTNLLNHKKYVGITRTSEKHRWSNGNGYSENEKFYNDIQKYGWNDGFSHEIIKENLTYKEARNYERYYISKYDTVASGYNKANFNLGNVFQFDFDNFIPIDNEYVDNPKKEYFTRIPNKFIQTNIKKKYNVHRIFYIVYILIDRHRDYINQSYITISEIFELCNYKQSRRKPKIFYEIIKVLLFFNESNMIKITSTFDIYNVGYNDCIQMDIICDNFDPTENFSKISSSQYNFIMMNESSINRENILMAFLYINSYIYIRPKKDNKEVLNNPAEKPEAFWRSIKVMADDLSMSKDTLNQCIHCLTTSIGDKEPLLIKKTVGYIQPDPSKPPKSIPNIYVLNKDGYEQEIEWAIQKMLEIYKVDTFAQMKEGDIN